MCERFLGFYENFSEKGLEIRICDAEKPPVVAADPLALNRVLNNLIQNLLRYAQGTIIISFSEENDCAAVTISNETAAALPEETDRIFDRFYTVDPSRSSRSAGLGLYISRKLVTGMGGEISARKDGNKLVVTMKFPRARAD